MMKNSKITFWAATTICPLVMACNVAAAPMTINDTGIVGIVEAGTAAANDANRTAWANHLLGMAIDSTDTVGRIAYATGINDYSGTLLLGDAMKGSGTDVSGFEWVMAKYGGKNAGYVLFYIPDYGTTIPLTSESLWVNRAKNGFALSDWTGYGRIEPTPTIVADGGATLILLGAACASMAFVRRFQKA